MYKRYLSVNGKILRVLMIVALVLSLTPSANATMIPASDLSTSEDGWWTAIAALPLAKFVVVAVVTTVVVKSIIASVSDTAAEKMGHGEVDLKIVKFKVADIEVEAETNGATYLPFGYASALAEGAAHVRFTNEPSSADIATVIAIVSPDDSGEFQLSAGVADPCTESASAFFDFNFGIGDPANHLNISGSPLYSFHEEITNGTIGGLIPESSFAFDLAPGESIDFVGNFQIGGESMTVPEPGMLSLFALGGLALLRRRRRHID